MAASTTTMLRAIRPSRFRSLLHDTGLNCSGSIRTYLSPAYYCQSEWQNQMNSSLLTGMKLNALSQSLHAQFEEQKEISAVDIEILALKIPEAADTDQLDYSESLLQKYRKCNFALNASPCYHQAVIRSYLDVGQQSRLIYILKKKYEYGIFVDDYSANMLMDWFLKAKNYQAAADVAFEVSLQEESSNPITRSLSLISCLQFLANAKPEQLNPPAPPKEVDDGKEVKIKVKYIRNDFFDHHFDLTNPQRLVGNALAYFCRNDSSGVGTSCFTMGMALLHENGQVMVDHLKRVVEQKVKVNKDVIAWLEKLPANENAAMDQQVKALIEKVKAEHVDADATPLVSHLEKLLGAQLKQHESKDIEHLRGLIAKWAGERDQRYQKEQHRQLVAKKSSEIEAQLKALEEKEELLTFFKKEKDIVMTQWDGGIRKEPPPFTEEEMELKLMQRKHYKTYKKELLPKPRHRGPPKPRV